MSDSCKESASSKSNDNDVCDVNNLLNNMNIGVAPYQYLLIVARKVQVTRLTTYATNVNQ